MKINAITVPVDSGDELAHRFAARAGAVDGVDGFEGFDLLKPTDGREVWLVVTRWRDEDSFTAWTTSAAFAHGHGRRPEGHTAGAHAASHAHGSDHATSHAHASGHAAPVAESGSEGEAPRRPVGTSAELWSFVVAGGNGPA